MIYHSKSSGMEREGFGKRHPEESTELYFLSCVGGIHRCCLIIVLNYLLYIPFFMHDAQKDRKISKRRQSN